MSRRLRSAFGRMRMGSSPCIYADGSQRHAPCFKSCTCARWTVYYMDWRYALPTTAKYRPNGFQKADVRDRRLRVDGAISLPGGHRGQPASSCNSTYRCRLSKSRRLQGTEAAGMRFIKALFLVAAAYVMSVTADRAADLCPAGPFETDPR